MLLRLYCFLSTLKANFEADRKGVSALEYALMASLIAVVIIAAVTSLGSNASKVFNNVANQLKAS